MPWFAFAGLSLQRRRRTVVCVSHLGTDFQEPYISLTVEQLEYINCGEKFAERAGSLVP